MSIKVIKVAKKKTLKEQASENTTVVTKKAKESDKVVKEGIPLNHATKHQEDKGQPDKLVRTIGMSMGVTKNMGDYESLRVDCWLNDALLEGETQEKALVRLGDIIQKQIEYEVDRIMG